MGRANAKSPFPPPPDQYYNRILQQFKSMGHDPDAPDAPRLSLQDVRGINNDAGVLDRDYLDYIVGQMRTRQVLFFTMDWGANVQDQFNQFMIQFFVKVWKWGLIGNHFRPAAKQEFLRIEQDDMIMAAVFVKHFKYLRTQYKKLIKDSNALVEEQANNSRSVALQRVSLPVFLISSAIVVFK